MVFTVAGTLAPWLQAGVCYLIHLTSQCHSSLTSTSRHHFRASTAFSWAHLSPYWALTLQTGLGTPQPDLFYSIQQCTQVKSRTALAASSQPDRKLLRSLSMDDLNEPE